MSRILLSLAIAVALVAPSASEAQKATTSGKKLYRWVDKDGKVQFSDALPAEAIDQARTEMSNSGRVVADVDRAMTAEERAAAARVAAEEARRKAEAEQTRKSEEAMIASFETEEDLKRSMQERVILLQQTLDAIEAGIASQRASLAALLLQASEIELAGGKVPPPQIETVRGLHREIGKQQQMLVLKQGELVDVDRDLEYLIKRFRELKSEQAGVPVPTPEPTTDAPAEPAAPADAPAGETPTG